MNKKHTTAVCLAVLCLACLVRESNARPPWLDYDSKVFTQSAACSTDVELLDLCQRCAKLTKAKNALDSCCSLDMEARRYCRDYVYFGSVKYDFNN